MFAEVISIEISLGDGFEVEPSDVDGYVGDAYAKVLVPEVFISVETRIDGDLWTLKVDGDPAKFVFRRDDSVDPPTYGIVYQEDLAQPGARALIRTVTWGAIKAGF